MPEFTEDHLNKKSSIRDSKIRSSLRSSKKSLQKQLTKKSKDENLAEEEEKMAELIQH